jgi:hypothetical protein
MTEEIKFKENKVQRKCSKKMCEMKTFHCLHSLSSTRNNPERRGQVWMWGGAFWLRSEHSVLHSCRESVNLWIGRWSEIKILLTLRASKFSLLNHCSKTIWLNTSAYISESIKVVHTSDIFWTAEHYYSSICKFELSYKLKIWYHKTECDMPMICGSQIWSHSSIVSR